MPFLALSNPAIRKLVDDFADQILEFSRTCVLDVLNEVLPGSSVGLPRPAKKSVAPRAVAPKVSSVIKTVPKGYKPPVSQEIKDAVLSHLLAIKEPATSSVLAQKTGLGETSVRIALKHLVDDGTVHRSESNRKVFYETA